MGINTSAVSTSTSSSSSVPQEGFQSLAEFKNWVSGLSFRPDMALLYEILGLMERSGVNMQQFMDRLNKEILSIQKDANKDRMWGQIAGAICSIVVSTVALVVAGVGCSSLTKNSELGKGDSYVSNGTARIQIGNLVGGLGQSFGQVPTAIMERKAADQEADAQFITRAYQAILEAYQKNYGLGGVINGAISA